MTVRRESSIVLYAAPYSSATPVLQAVAELDVPHELHLFDLAEGRQREPEFLALNPNGKVPTLVVDGTPMFEALAILHWLGERFGVSRGLWPTADDPARLQALSWTTWSYVTFAATLQRFNQAASERVPAELHHPAQAERASTELQTLLGLLDARLAARPYLLGDTYSLADLIVGSVITYGTFAGAPADAHPHVTAWLARCHDRDSYRKAWGSAAA